MNVFITVQHPTKLVALDKNHNLDTILRISANKVFYIVLHLASKNYKN